MGRKNEDRSPGRENGATIVIVERKSGTSQQAAPAADRESTTKMSVKVKEKAATDEKWEDEKTVSAAAVRNASKYPHRDRTLSPPPRESRRYSRSPARKRTSPSRASLDRRTSDRVTKSRSLERRSQSETSKKRSKSPSLKPIKKEMRSPSPAGEAAAKQAGGVAQGGLVSAVKMEEQEDAGPEGVSAHRGNDRGGRGSPHRGRGSSSPRGNRGRGGSYKNGRGSSQSRDNRKSSSPYNKRDRDGGDGGGGHQERKNGDGGAGAGRSVVRQWARHQSSIDGASYGFKFKVMTYNLLAPSLVRSNMHIYVSHCQKHGRLILDWEWRGPALVREIRDNDCDIVCVQELDRDYFPQFQELLDRAGYAGWYQQCTGPKIDGVAIFVKKQKFDVVSTEFISYEPCKHNAALIVNARIPYLESNGVLAGREVVIATTHILWSPNSGAVKLQQMNMLFQRIWTKVQEREMQTGFEVPVVLCGDFNMLPYSLLYNYVRTGGTDTTWLPDKLWSGQNRNPNRAQVAALFDDAMRWEVGMVDPRTGAMSAGRLDVRTQVVGADGGVTETMAMDVDQVDSSGNATSVHAQRTITVQKTGGPQVQASANGVPSPKPVVRLPPDAWSKSATVTHPFDFNCVYAPHRDPNTNEVYTTTWHDGGKETVDYIYYGCVKRAWEENSAQRTVLKCLRYLQPPLGSVLRKMPHPQAPSDHVYLMAEFGVASQ
ncbi:Protein angel 2 [Borealophlyctis nickersoniae]|nr:Protein angel 2 [Borealophlyctis nickersoniae]